MSCIKTAFRQFDIVYLAICFALLSVASFGQTPGTGAVSGIVYDPANKVVSNATVIATNDATQFSRTVSTTTEGLFRVPLLLPGIYSVTVTAPGFAENTSHAIQVTVSKTISLNITLAVAGEKTDVQVNANSETADLESSTLGGLVNQTAIQSLPLSSRNYTQIIGLAPGVVVDLPTATALGAGTQNVASNGATPTANNIQFNGVDANNLAQNSAAPSESSIPGVAIPAPDSIQEFRVQTANFDAAYGRGTGANVDLVSRSGTNQFHGSAWEFVRNNIFNANDFFSKLVGQPRADLKQNQFGATVGGPIRRDRTFFFGEYQGLTEINGLGDEQNPVYPLLTNDRSAATLGAQFCPAGHLDDQGNPATGYLTQAGGTQVACDGSNINPVALEILNAKLPNGQFAVPTPQHALPSTGPDASDQLPLGQSTYALPAHYREDQFTVDIDQILTPKNTLAGRFFWSRIPATLPFSPNGAATVPGWPTNQLTRYTMFVLPDTHVFNPNLVNIARFGYMRYDGLSTIQNPITAQQIGQGVPTGAPSATSNAPALMVAGLTIGDAGTPSQWQVTNSFAYQDTVAWTKGRHNARFGIEFKRHQVDLDSPIETDGLLQIATFGDFLVGQSATQNGSPLGLSNVTTSQAGAGIFRRNERYIDFAGFVQDDIRVLPTLTLNAGLRYEIFGAPTETGGRLTNFDAAIATKQVPLSGTFSGFTVPSNFQVAIPQGVVQTSYPGLWRTPHGDLGPRFGFVWQMTQKPIVLLRGGFGVYYDRHSGNLVEVGISQPPYSTLQIVSGAANAGATLQSPFVPQTLPSSSYPIFMPRTPTSTPFIQGTDPHLLDGTTQEYNLNVEYDLGRDYLLQVGYVGTRSYHRPAQYQFDQALLASPQNPVNGQTTNSVNNVVARLPYQGISQGSLFTKSFFIGNYNALQASITKRLQHGFQLQASYVWSKNLDELNGEGGIDTFELQLPTNNNYAIRDSSYGLAGDDRDQRVVANFTWFTPRFQSFSSVPRHLLTNWELSGIALFQAGAPLNIFDSNAGSVYGLLPLVRAQVTGKSPSTHGSLFSRVMNSYLDPAAFTRAPEAPFGTSLADQDFGNSSVGLVRGPGQHNFDFAVERAFPIKETTSLRFRAEAFNLTNTPQFGSPNNNLGYGDPTQPNPVASASFGKITGEQDGPHPRIIQFALKYMF